VLTVKMTVLSDVMPCSSLDMDQHFRVICSLQLQSRVMYLIYMFCSLKMEVAGSSKMFAPIYRTAWCHIQKIVIFFFNVLLILLAG
jgi:hypothetical protein